MWSQLSTPCQLAERRPGAFTSVASAGRTSTWGTITGKLLGLLHSPRVGVDQRDAQRLLVAVELLLACRRVPTPSRRDRRFLLPSVLPATSAPWGPGPSRGHPPGASFGLR